ncbi:MAG: AAA family ATPase [Nocardioides sp.]
MPMVATVPAASPAAQVRALSFMIVPFDVSSVEVQRLDLDPTRHPGKPDTCAHVSSGKNAHVRALGTSAIVGRDRELSEVKRWIARLADGPAALVLSGEPGIGKTTLWEAAVASSRTANFRVLVARPVQAELALGFSALADLLDDVADDVLPRLPDPLARALASALLRTDPEPGLDPHAVGRGLVEAIRVLETRGPVVLAVDDIQWLDAPSTRAITFAARRLEGSTGLLATWRRAEDDEDPLDLQRGLGDRLTTLDVGPLSADASHDVLRRAGSHLPQRVLQRLHTESGGNPFYALELARSAATPGLSPALKVVVGQRLSRLPDIARPVVEMAAVLGPIDAGLLTRFLEGGEAALDAAVESGLMVIRDGQACFDHPLLAAGAYESIAPGRRRDLHRQARELVHGLEEQARHVALATDGHDGAAAALLEHAALAARARGALESGAELARQARRLTPAGNAADHARRTVVQADLLYLAGADQEASGLVDDVLRSDVRGLSRARALIHRVQHDEEPHVAVARLEEAVIEAASDDVVRARALAALAWMRGVWAGDLETAVHEAEAAVTLAESTSDSAVLATALTTAAIVRTYRGDPDAEIYFQRAIESTDGVEWIAGDRSPVVAFAHQRFWQGDWEGADALLGRERAQAAQNGEDSRLERLNLFEADLAIRRGRWSDADRLLHDALAWAPPGYWRTRALLLRALLRARRGSQEALDDVADASSSPATTADPALAATARYAIGLVALADGRAQDAAACLTPLPDFLETHGLRELAILLVAPDAVEALVNAGDLASAVVATEHLQRRAEASQHPLGLPAAARCRGLLSLAHGDLDSALSELAVSREGFERIDMPYELARTLLVEGNALRRAGRRALAGDAL